MAGDLDRLLASLAPVGGIPVSTLGALALQTRPNKKVLRRKESTQTQSPMPFDDLLRQQQRITTEMPKRSTKWDPLGVDPASVTPYDMLLAHEAISPLIPKTYTKPEDFDVPGFTPPFLRTSTPEPKPLTPMQKILMHSRPTRVQQQIAEDAAQFGMTPEKYKEVVKKFGVHAIVQGQEGRERTKAFIRRMEDPSYLMTGAGAMLSSALTGAPEEETPSFWGGILNYNAPGAADQLAQMKGGRAAIARTAMSFAEPESLLLMKGLGRLGAASPWAGRLASGIFAGQQGYDAYNQWQSGDHRGAVVTALLAGLAADHATGSKVTGGLKNYAKTWLDAGDTRTTPLFNLGETSLKNGGYDPLSTSIGGSPKPKLTLKDLLGEISDRQNAPQPTANTRPLKTATKQRSLKAEVDEVGHVLQNFVGENGGFGAHLDSSGINLHRDAAGSRAGEFGANGEPSQFSPGSRLNTGEYASQGALFENPKFTRSSNKVARQQISDFIKTQNSEFLKRGGVYRIYLFDNMFGKRSLEIRQVNGKMEYSIKKDVPVQQKHDPFGNELDVRAAEYQPFRQNKPPEILVFKGGKTFAEWAHELLHFSDQMADRHPLEEQLGGELLFNDPVTGRNYHRDMYQRLDDLWREHGGWGEHRYREFNAAEERSIVARLRDMGFVEPKKKINITIVKRKR